jgi:RHS repeat-associated protein
VVVERLAYDPWGKRRFINGTADTLDAITSANIDRGFTMHEHIDEMGIINMNGRIYDPLIGRFMSADPIIQAPYNLKSFNRYSYVWNNPLKFFDPAGFEVWNKAPDGTNTQTVSSGEGDASNSYTGETGISCNSCGPGTRGQGVSGPGVGSSSCRSGGCTIDANGNPIVTGIKTPVGLMPNNPSATKKPDPPAVAPPTPPTPASQIPGQTLTAPPPDNTNQTMLQQFLDNPYVREALRVLDGLPQFALVAKPLKVLQAAENAEKALIETKAVLTVDAKIAKDLSKVDSIDKQALVSMAKEDKKVGITSADMQAYKDLNRTLIDPYPTNLVRGPERHPTAASPASRASHGHVGPVGHIPVN